MQTRQNKKMHFLRKNEEQSQKSDFSPYTYDNIYSIRVHECQKLDFLPIHVWQHDTHMDVQICTKSIKHVFKRMNPDFLNLSFI